MGELRWLRTHAGIWCSLGSAFHIESLGLGRDTPEFESQLQYFQQCVKSIKPPQSLFPHL